jgi:hypothetical protein
MVDTQLRHLAAARTKRLPRGLTRGGYGVVTLHRSGNVDKPERLIALLDALAAAARHLPLVWPIHPRAAAQMKAFGFVPPAGVRITPPLGYLEFLSLLCRARLVATDSGGVQEEATALGLPCLTLRGATERPITIAAGMNRLATPEELPLLVAEILNAPLRLPRLFAVLVNPRVAVSTAAVFGRLGLAPGATLPMPEPAPLPSEHLAAMGIDAFITDVLAPLPNDLEAPARALAPVITEVIDLLAAALGCRLARMSGSGATCFGLFGSCGESAEAARAIRSAHPNWWIKPTILR